MTQIAYADALKQINDWRSANGYSTLSRLPDLTTHCEQCGFAYHEKDLGGGRCLSCGAMIAAPPTIILDAPVQRVYVVSFAPAYDQGSVGGHEWRRTWEEIHELLRDPELIAPSCDYRILTLDLPADLDDASITDFLGSGPGNELIEPPDPRTDLDEFLAAWRGDDTPVVADDESVITIRIRCREQDETGIRAALDNCIECLDGVLDVNNDVT